MNMYKKQLIRTLHYINMVEEQMVSTDIERCRVKRLEEENSRLKQALLIQESQVELLRRQVQARINSTKQIINADATVSVLA